MAKVEREQIKERTSRGMLARAHAEKPTLDPRAPYGYSCNEERTALVLDLVQAPVVRRMFTESAAGRSLRAIAHGLTADGIPTIKGGDRWDQTTVRWILGQCICTGSLAAFRWQAPKVKGKGMIPAPSMSRSSYPMGSLQY